MEHFSTKALMFATFLDDYRIVRNDNRVLGRTNSLTGARQLFAAEKRAVTIERAIIVDGMPGWIKLAE